MSFYKVLADKIAERLSISKSLSEVRVPEVVYRQLYMEFRTAAREPELFDKELETRYKVHKLTSGRLFICGVPIIWDDTVPFYEFGAKK